MRNLKQSTCKTCSNIFSHGSDCWGKFCCQNCASNYKQKLYEENPKFCLRCNEKIAYEKRFNKFCSQSCSASTTNSIRPKKEKIKKLYYIPKDKPINVCITCSTSFTAFGKRHKFCSVKCRALSSKQLYRNETRFTLNKVDHTLLFKQNLIQKYGWYCPANKGVYNPYGVSWDHLYRVEDGYKNQVDPKVMKHPANAELLPWQYNFERKQSMITLEQLYERIKLWDNSQFDQLEYFYKE